MSNVSAESRQHARELLRRKVLKKARTPILQVYELYKREHEQMGLPGNPVSQASFYRLFRAFPTVDRILAQKGKKAAREYERLSTGSAQRPGFMVSSQCDALHEPIKLLNPFDFTVCPKSPVHHFVVETHTTVMTGIASNYETGSERAEFVIDSLKSAMLPKPNMQETWGCVNNWPCYGKTFEHVLDAGSAYLCTNTDTFLSITHQASRTTRTRQPYEKDLIEVINKIVKEGFTLTLDGAYDDKLEDAEKEKIVPVYTRLEHQILLYRYIIDVYNQKVNKGAPGGLTRIEHWLREAQRQPPVLPPNPTQVVNFLGAEQRKTIMEKKGIHITILGKAYRYNSKRLQTLGRKIRENISDKAKRRVFLKFSANQPDFIMVKDPYTEKPFRVDRCECNRGDIDLRRRFHHNIDPLFFEMQDMDILSQMSTEEIHAHAKERRRAMDAAARAGRRRNGARAVALDVAARNAERTLHEATERAQESADDPANDPGNMEVTTSPRPYEAPDLAWGSSV